MLSLSGEIAVVTGASRGIGAAIARSLAEHGAMVIGTATTGDGAQRVEQMLRDAPSPGRGLVLDVADMASVDAGFASLAASALMPGILVNNAGIARDALLARMKDEQWDVVINTDLTSLYRTCKACVRHLMKRRGGRIVNVTSVVAFTGQRRADELRCGEGRHRRIHACSGEGARKSVDHRQRRRPRVHRYRHDPRDWAWTT